MSDENPIIKIDARGLGKAAALLIEKVSEAIAGIARPRQIVRLAKAEAEAEQIRAESQIQITDLQRRALARFIQEEGRRQENIEEITRKALPQLDEESEPSRMENDWVANFFDKCRLISDEDMQILWSKILAGEANKPGTFSKRTVNAVCSLDKRDAELFTKLCTFCWHCERAITPFVYRVEDPIYDEYEVTFMSLNHLDSIGLVEFNVHGQFVRKKLPKEYAVSYFGEPITLVLPESDNEIEIGKVLLTRLGLELFPICGARPDSRVRDYIIVKWSELGYLEKPKAQ